ncbi:hypothetical protein [Butyrivibrio sp. INlla21]|uniref:hypothetical protein n=1 Tax=Butyrivibrio sp. INlla21 TaxID=1520811 RepID=UPI0008F3BE80|nr:hypothetical protein [Butyrivibrio sp. INlla21]SFU33732.1 hypothetical protein SAMN02910342_00135 [Butyrivibrio sp. INlla21]
MSEFSANAIQVVNPGESVIFTESPVPNRNGLVRHRDDTGNFLLSGFIPQSGCNCGCCRNSSASYLVDFGANVSIPTGGTVGPISLAIAIDGATLPATTMIVTPAAVDEYFNVSRAANVEIWNGCCETVTVRNTSDQAIQVQNANIIFARPDLD